MTYSISFLIPLEFSRSSHHSLFSTTLVSLIYPDIISAFRAEHVLLSPHFTLTACPLLSRSCTLCSANAVSFLLQISRRSSTPVLLSPKQGFNEDVLNCSKSHNPAFFSCPCVSSRKGSFLELDLPGRAETSGHVPVSGPRPRTSSPYRATSQVLLTSASP